MSERNYWKRQSGRRLSRRTLLGASARAGVGAAGLALVGCGDDDDDAAVAEIPAEQEQAAQQQVAEQQAEQTVEQEEAVAQEQAMEQEEEQAVAQAGPIRGGTIRGTFVGLSSGNPPTLDPFENLTYRAQIPAGYHYSGILSYIEGAPGVDPLNYAVVVGDGFQIPEVVDETTFVAELQDNFFWHDREPLNGRAVTMDDFLFTVDRFREMSANALSWDTTVESVTPIDERTVQFKLVKPFAPFFNLLGSAEHIKFIPPEIVEDGTVAERPVGSGPWVFETFEPDVELTWSGSSNWHQEGLPLLDGLVASMIADPSTILANLEGGTFDYSLLDGTVFGTAQEQIPELTFSFNGDQVFGGLYFNFSIPPFNDPRVRQAISLAMDRDGIRQAIDTTGRAGWHTAIPQLAPYWMNPEDKELFSRNVEFFHRDVERAVALLDAAGFPDGIEAVVHGTAAYGDTWNLLMDTTLATIRDAGIRTRRENKEYAAYIATTFIGDFESGGDAAFANGPLKVGVEPDDIFFTNYHPDAGRRNGGAGPGDISEDTALLAAFDAQRRELDLETRVEMINEIQRDMAESLYIVPWLAQAGVFSTMPQVQDFYYKSSFRFGTETLPRVWLDDSKRV